MYKFVLQRFMEGMNEIESELHADKNLRKRFTIYT